jgi:hypothetical protein
LLINLKLIVYFIVSAQYHFELEIIESVVGLAHLSFILIVSEVFIQLIMDLGFFMVLLS